LLAVSIGSVWVWRCPVSSVAPHSNDVSLCPGSVSKQLRKRTSPHVGDVETVARATDDEVTTRFPAPSVNRRMSLDDLKSDVEAHNADVGESIAVDVDRQTRNELAMLSAALDPADTDELVRQAIHAFFQANVERGTLDFHLRSAYDCTYDEYLSGMTFDEMTGNQFPQKQDKDDRRYQF